MKNTCHRASVCLRGWGGVESLFGRILFEHGFSLRGASLIVMMMIIQVMIMMKDFLHCSVAVAGLLCNTDDDHNSVDDDKSSDDDGDKRFSPMHSSSCRFFYFVSPMTFILSFICPLVRLL